MTKLYIETNDTITLYNTYETDKQARMAIVEYCDKHNFKSYYWNCYEMPADSEYAGGLHVDFGSWSTFFIIV